MMNPPSAHFDSRRSSSLDEEELRDFDAATTHDAVDVAAATWLTRQQHGLSLEEAEAFAHWLADPLHAQAYAVMQNDLVHVQALPSEVIAGWRQVAAASVADAADAVAATSTDNAPLHELTSLQATSSQSNSRKASLSKPTRRIWLFGSVPRAAFAVLLCGVAGGWLGWSVWQNQPTFQKTYISERGQLRNVDLPDGSTLLLDTATTAEVTLRRNRREVVLRDGQALFTVAADAAKPFDVLVGTLRVTVVGTRFAVRHAASGIDATHTHVAVEHGRVRVAGTDQSSPAVELHAGQSISGDGAGKLGSLTLIPPQAVAPWQQNRVSFDDTPLAQAVAEFERYGASGLVVHPSVAGLRVGGSFDVRQPMRFASVLPALLPVRLQTRGTVTEIVARP